MTTAEPDKEKKKTFYLIDGHAQFFRAYYAIRSGMTSPVTGEPTNMTFGFVGMMLKLLREYRPDYLAVAIDTSGGAGTFRGEMYPEYKANRDEAPDDFGPQVERCLELLAKMEVPVVGVDRYEADDVIATMAERLRRERPEVEIRIISRDKDLTQVLRDGVQLFDVHKDEHVTAADVFKTEGVKPEHVVDILTLMGDTVDNIPGVPGIGPKTAAKLILEYGSVDSLMANIDKIKGKRRENLEASRDLISLSRSLVQLKDDVEFEFDLEAASSEPGALPVEELVAMFRELGFTQHQRTLKALVGVDIEGSDTSGKKQDEKKKDASKDAGGDEFAGGLFGSVMSDAPAAHGTTSGGADYRAVKTVEKLEELVKLIRGQGECAVDTETDSLMPVEANLCGVSVSVKPGEAFYIPTRSPAEGTHLDSETVVRHLKPVLEDEKILKIGQNLKYDMNVLRRHGLDLRLGGSKSLFDTMVASYVIDATRSSHGMDVLALALLNHTCIPITELIGRGKKQITFDKVPLEDAVPYAAEDADITLQLRDVFAPRLEEMGLNGLFADVEMPLVEVLAELEFNGIKVDREELERQREKLSVRIEDLRKQIGEASELPFNPNSPKELAAVLFNKPDGDPPGLGLKVIKKGKTGPSTDQEVLEKLVEDPAVESVLPGLIIEYRQLTKLVNTYLVALGEAINEETGRVHASFNQTVAATGRLSSSDPNLQNIPIRTEVGREIRRAFVAEDGCVLITADYSQIELRLLAHLSKDAALIEAFKQGMDIHRAVAAEVFDVSPDEVDGGQRATAKMVNFGIVYGITAYGLSRRLGGKVSVEEAGQIIADYKARYAGIDTFLAECVAEAESKGYVETILGRRREIPQIRARHQQQRALGERMAINTVVQGSAADLIKLAMIDLYQRLPVEYPKAKMLLQIHDELVFESPEEEAEAVQGFVVQRMEAAAELEVPLVVDAARSRTWIDAK